MDLKDTNHGNNSQTDAMNPGAGHSRQGYIPSGYSNPNIPAPLPAAYPGYSAPSTMAPYGYVHTPQVTFQGASTTQNIAQSPVCVWMPVPAPIPNCPPGLEYLSQINQVLIHQHIEMLEVLVGFETNNKFEIKNILGQRVYFAAEENDCCTRNCLGTIRPFVITVIDNIGREVMKIMRPHRCDSCCFPCCLQKLEVQAPPGTPIGYVIQKWHPCLPTFIIQNEKQENILKIVGPCVTCGCCSDVNFQVKSLNETTVVGNISKKWSGLAQEMFTDADNFGITFPMDLDVKIKAVMLGACFLIDFMYFEKSD